MQVGLSRSEVTEVHRRYGFFLHRRCRLLLRDVALADDALQEVYVKLLRTGGAMREAKHPMRWLHRVCDHACFDQLRRGKRIRHATPIDVSSRHLTTAARLAPTISDVINTVPEICASAGTRNMAPPAEISLMMQLYWMPDSVTSLAISTIRSRTNFRCLEDMSRRYHGGADVS